MLPAIKEEIVEEMAPPENPENQTPARGCKARPRDYKEGEDFTSYLNHFNRVAAANRWDEAAKLVQLETLLKGKAQRQFEEFIEETPNITWAVMTEQLSTELKPTSQQSLNAFGQLRMEGRSPKEFYAALVRLSKIGHGNMGDDARHAVVRAQMLLALPEQLRKDASKQRDLSGLTKDQLLTILTRVYDADLREVSRGSTYEPVVNAVQSTPHRTVEARLSDLEGAVGRERSDIAELKLLVKSLSEDLKLKSGQGKPSEAPQRRMQSGDSVRCFKCQQMGHYARSCGNERVCSYCRKEGHGYADCPRKPSKNE